MSKKFKIVEDLGMFRVRWPDGVLSEDSYNLSRAKNHASVLYETSAREARRMAGIGPTT